LGDAVCRVNKKTKKSGVGDSVGGPQDTKNPTAEKAESLSRFFEERIEREGPDRETEGVAGH